MNILLVCAEVAPFVSVGGLSQVMYFLPRALTHLGHDVRIFTPKYGKMETGTREGKLWKMKDDFRGLRVPVARNVNDTQLKQDNWDFLTCNVKEYIDKRRSIHAYFLENTEYYELRANVFGYMDDHIRFALLSKGCLEWLLQKDRESWFPDIIHCNDWHTSYLLEMARRDTRYKKLLSKTSAILTVHNFAFQGNYDYRFAKKEDRDDGAKDLEPILSPRLQKQNALMRGLLYADAVNTVSPTHAVEILTPEYAENLYDTLQKVKGKLLGIMNGLDTDEFNPATDPIIKVRYTEKTFSKGKQINKQDLQKLFFLPVKPESPLIVFSGRLCRQKGLDIILEMLPSLFELKPEVQVVVLGGGDDAYRNKLMELQKLYPSQLGLHLQSDFRLPRKLFAGADMFLVPSIYEPGGIVALEALRYGAVPIVRRTGGLNDIIEDFNPVTGKGNGFSFVPKSSWALFGCIIEAMAIYKQQKLWRKLVANCLQCDFSWSKAAKEYDIWYRQIIEERKRAVKPMAHPAYSTPAINSSE